MSDGLSESLDRAQALIESGRFDEALAILDALKNQHPDSIELWFALGRAQGMLGREAEAEAAFARAVQLRPGMHEAHLNLALSRVYQQKLRAAIPSFVAARKLQPDFPGLDKTLLDILQSVLQQEGGRPARLLSPGALRDAPLVSVVIPTRNRSALLKDALESVVRQTYRNWEIVVVNDGGEDIAGVIGTLPKSDAAKVTVLRLPASSGAGCARNRAIENARGEVVAFLDDDDLYLPGHLQALVAGLRESGAGVAYTLSDKVIEQVLGVERVELRRNPVFQDFSYSRALLLVRNFIPIDNWGVRRACFAECGQFDESLACMEDWDLLLRFSERADFHRVAQVTADVRVRKGVPNDSVSSRTPALATCRLLYARHSSHGNELIDLARELYLKALFPQLAERVGFEPTVRD